MHIPFLNKYRRITYVQLSEVRLKINDIGSDKIFDEPSILAILTQETGRKVILAVGNKASTALEEQNTVSFNPFSSPGSLQKNFYYAKKFLTYAMAKVYTGNFAFLKPNVIIYPEYRNELSEIEVKTYRKLAHASGAANVKIHTESQLITNDKISWNSL